MEFLLNADFKCYSKELLTLTFSLYISSTYCLLSFLLQKGKIETDDIEMCHEKNREINQICIL